MEHEVLKAELPPMPAHPRALLTVLEGLAMWAGDPLSAVICARRQLTLRYDGIRGHVVPFTHLE